MNRIPLFPRETGVNAGFLLSRSILALTPVLVAFIVQLMIWPIVRPFAWFLFSPAVFLSAWIGGRWFGGLAAVVATLLTWYFFLPPEFSFVERDVGDIVAALTFMGTGVVFSIFHDRLKRANRKVADALAATCYQAQLESVIQAIQNGIVVTDMAGNIILANEAEARMFGFPSAEAMKRELTFYRDFFEIGDPDGRPLPIEEWPINKILKGESIRDYELRVRRRDSGQEWFISCNGEPVRDGQGKQILAVLGILDITERKRAEDAKLRQAALRADVSAALAYPVGSLQSILQQNAEAVVRHLDAAFARIWTLNQQESMLELQASAGLYTHLNGSHSRVPVGKLKIGLIAKEGQPHMTNDVRTDPRINDQKWARDQGMVSFAGYPLLVEDRVVGVMAMFARHPLTEDTVEALASVAATIAQGIERKRAEEALRENQETLRLFIENAPAALAMFDREMRYLAVSRRWIVDYRLGDGDIIGRSHYDVFPELPERWKTAHRRALEGEIVRADEDRFVLADGAVQCLRWEVRPWYAANGAIGGIVIFAEDITERKRAEESLRASENRFRVTFENAAVGIARVAPDGCFLEVNQRLCDIVGYAREELVTKTFSDITHPDDLDADWKQRRRLLAGEIEHYSLEKRYYRKDGSIVWGDVTSSLMRKPDGSPDYCISVYEDISSRKRAEERLREREERLSLASRAAGLGVFEWDAQSDRMVWENERMYEIFGHTRADGALSKAQLIERYTHPEDIATFERALADGMKSKRPFHSAFRIRRKDGAIRWLDLAGQFELALDGAPMRMIGVLADITERKQAEEERKQLALEQAARAAAEAANRSKDEFLAMVSHELRSPLNAILGYTRMLRSSPVDRDAINNVTAIVERNAKAQLQIIEDLLDSARIISGKLRIEPVPVDLAPELEAALDTVRAAAEAKGVTLVVDFGSGPEQAFGDPTRLQQIVWNLLTNAIKFTSEGGRIELRMESDADHIRIIVSDDGKGIVPEILPFVFDRFRQADSSTTRRYGGLGLGLSLVKHLVELHGGTITAASDGAGRGATFTVTLPSRQQEFIKPPTPAVAPRDVRTEDSITVAWDLSLDCVSVLVVDDQEDARELLIKALSEYGAQVTAVSSGAEALAFLSNPPGGKRPDTLIMDIAMPDEDGYIALKRVRALEAEQGVGANQIPAIALTAHGRSEDRLRALQAGFQMHVTKPVEPAELAVVINSLTTRLAWERKRSGSGE